MAGLQEALHHYPRRAAELPADLACDADELEAAPGVQCTSTAPLASIRDHHGVEPRHPRDLDQVGEQERADAATTHSPIDVDRVLDGRRWAARSL